MSGFSREEERIIKELPLDLLNLPSEKRMPYLKETIAKFGKDNQEIATAIVIATLTVGDGKVDDNKNRRSYIYKIATFWSIIPVFFGIVAIILAYLKTEGTSHISLLGQTIQTSSTAIACIAIALITGYFIAKNAINKF
ncbi:hypothetical protein [Ensifer adhaerens]|uniref:hypothetical protein n=1 Tax=Ensifer adhaerens TaxID=106592 RepID=UPI001C4E12AA|nr:hypothetical protein [Ensifer adhaerens]MBW0370581.1 hypothetical protein [Ensifer adhaerens]UCM21601.1 hypothetical protein LDL63_08495 [Ensifer adhaerens]